LIKFRDLGVFPGADSNLVPRFYLRVGELGDRGWVGAALWLTGTGQKVKFVKRFLRILDLLLNNPEQQP